MAVRPTHTLLLARVFDSTNVARSTLPASRYLWHWRALLSLSAPSVGTLIDRFMEEYAPKRCRRHTQRNCRGMFENHIRPRWGSEFVENVRTVAVEDWLEDYPHSRQIKSHVRNLMHTLFHAFVRGVVNPTKTDASESILPLDSDLADMLLAYKG